MRDRKFAVRLTSEDVRLTNLLIGDNRPREYLFRQPNDLRIYMIMISYDLQNIIHVVINSFKSLYSREDGRIAIMLLFI